MVAQSFWLGEFVRRLDSWGLTDVMLPFLLVFVIIFAILQKTKILGDGKKNLNAAVAVVIGLLFVIPHVTGRYGFSPDPVEIMNDALPQISLVIIAVIFLLILIGVFGQDYVLLGVTMPGWITLIAFIVIILIFGGAAGWWNNAYGNTLERFFGTEGVAIFIMLLVFGVIIAWITSESKDKDDKSVLNRLGMDFSKLFGKK